MNDGQNLLLKTPPFQIEKYVLEPNGIALAPRGHVLHVGFVGDTAYAWVQHAVDSPIDMQLMTMPTGGPFEIEIDDANFERPRHVGSFMSPKKPKLGAKKDDALIGEALASVWHCFVFMPKSTIILQ